MINEEDKKARQRIANKKYRDKNKEKYKEYVKDHPDQIKEAKARYRNNNREKLQDYILKNYEWYIWNSCRNRCRRRNIEFNITVNDIKIPTHCPYLGVELTRIRYKGRQDYNPSLDRIDPTKGYTKDNIEVISDKANRMKNNANLEELIVFANAIIRKYSVC